MTGAYGQATTAGNYTLVCSGSTIGNWVESFVTKERRLNEVTERTSFWSTTTRLDGSYPALIFKHTFTVYFEAASRELFAKAFFDITNHFHGVGSPLFLISGYTSPVTIFFGNCYLTQEPQLKNPDALLLHSAGMISLEFTGTLVPSVA